MTDKEARIAYMATLIADVLIILILTVLANVMDRWWIILISLFVMPRMRIRKADEESVVQEEDKRLF